jgi:hypothetical protein
MANKKINQLVSKTAILSTDIFGIGDATTGQLFKKTIAELQAAIGGAVISVNGLVGTVVLDTDDIQELATPTNKYFTDARARGAISLTVTGNSGASTYSSGTGVLNVPTYTLAGLGGISATFLSGTSGISYNSTTGVISYSGTVYTDASIRALLSGSTGISYNSSTGAISYSGTVYTDSSVRALISITTTGTSGASTYNNTTGVINVPNYTLAGLGGISLTSLSGGTGISYNSSTGAISSTITQYTDALARASISITTTGTSGASTYNSTTGVINVPQYAAALSGTTNYVAKFTSSSTIGDSAITDNGTTVTLVSRALSGTSGTFSSTVTATSFFAGSGINQASLENGYLRFYHAASAAKYIKLSDDSTTIDAIGFSKNSAVATVWFPNGNVGIQTTSPGLSLSVQGLYGLPTSSGTQTSGILRVQDSSSNISLDMGVIQYVGSWIQSVNKSNSSALTLALNPNGGNVGIGTSSPTARLEVYGGESGMGQFTLAGTYGGIMRFAGSGVNKWAISVESGLGSDKFGIFSYGANAYVSVITSGGNTLLGTSTDNGERLYVSGAIRATGTITANSDLTLKKNLLKIENALEKVEQINGYTYELKEDDSKRHAGVIAQEIQEVLPEIVNTGNDGLMGVEYGNISALLIEAIKEQNTKIKNLETLLASK